MVLKQIDIDLPGTQKDIDDFKKLLKSFEFPKEHLTEIELTEPTPDQVHAKINEAFNMVRKNKSLGLKTFVTIFYAGHGAMLKN